MYAIKKFHYNQWVFLCKFTEFLTPSFYVVPSADRKRTTVLHCILLKVCISRNILVVTKKKEFRLKLCQPQLFNWSHFIGLFQQLFHNKSLSPPNTVLQSVHSTFIYVEQQIGWQQSYYIKVAQGDIFMEQKM